MRIQLKQEFPTWLPSTSGQGSSSSPRTGQGCTSHPPPSPGSNRHPHTAIRLPTPAPLSPQPHHRYLHAWLRQSSGASGGTGPAFSTAQEVGPRQSPCRLQSPQPTQPGMLQPGQRHLMPEHTLPSYGHARYSSRSALQHLHWRCHFPTNTDISHRLPLTLVGHRRLSPALGGQAQCQPCRPDCLMLINTHTVSGEDNSSTQYVSCLWYHTVSLMEAQVSTPGPQASFPYGRAQPLTSFLSSN